MKFDYELNSNVYSALAILNTSKLQTWLWHSFSEDYLKNATNLLLNAINQTAYKSTLPIEKINKK